MPIILLLFNCTPKQAFLPFFKESLYSARHSSNRHLKILLSLCFSMFALYYIILFFHFQVFFKTNSYILFFYQLGSLSKYTEILNTKNLKFKIRVHINKARRQPTNMP